MTLTRVLRNISNIPGWTTKRKLVIFESDDWGAIRMSSPDAYRKLRKQGIRAASSDEERYLLNDGLASENDLSGLFEVLYSVKDSNGSPAVFTALSVVANPMFDKIKENGYNEYFYEPFTETLKRYPNHSSSFELWNEGFKNKIFIPQFHGREHLNVCNWLKALREKNHDTLIAFQEGVYGITSCNPINHVSYQAAFDFVDLSEVEYHKIVITEGLDLFERIHGFKASFFVPTNGPFNNSLEETTAKMGISFIGASKIQSEPIGNGKFRTRFHYLGKKNFFNQRYLTRNASFEPSSNLRVDWVNSCMSDISDAFRWHKPAVISSHRVNYIGWLNSVNRDQGLTQLKCLLRNIVSTWPDVEFVTSDQLGNFISSKRN